MAKVLRAGMAVLLLVTTSFAGWIAIKGSQPVGVLGADPNGESADLADVSYWDYMTDRLQASSQTPANCHRTRLIFLAIALPVYPALYTTVALFPDSYLAGHVQPDPLIPELAPPTSSITWRQAHDALQAYLAVRGPGSAQLDYLFIYRHQPLSYRYCQVRLRTFGRKCGVQVTPHQLRHSCASLLLNAGAPILTVQAILGHKHIDTTLNYARLYDGTLAADYYRAMAQVEARLTLAVETQPVSNPEELLALVNLVQTGPLELSQMATLDRLRAGILALTGQGILVNMEDVKVLTAAP